MISIIIAMTTIRAPRTPPSEARWSSWPLPTDTDTMVVEVVAVEQECVGMGFMTGKEAVDCKVLVLLVLGTGSSVEDFMSVLTTL